MILVERGPEPDGLRKERLARLPELIRIACTREPRSEEIDGYRKPAADPLWRAQRYKCCYCEVKIPRSHNDVEHYRPKAAANRSPGSTATHGYWWLAFTWKNLLFACRTCNESKKRDRFPLALGSVALTARQNPPGREQSLLIDPAQESAVPHIEFVFSTLQPGTSAARGAPSPNWQLRKHWWPRARNSSVRGDQTIRVCGLDSGELVELYDDHVNKEVRPLTNKLEATMAAKADPAALNVEVVAEFEQALRLLHPSKPFVGLSYDALRGLLPNTKLVPWGLRWPEPDAVGVLPPRQPKESTKRRRKP